MATRADIRRISLSLPGVVEGETDFAFSVPHKDKLKGFAWVWKERVDPKKPRVPNPAVMAIRVANVAQRNVMIGAEPKKFFTEPHYAGFPAVLVRIAEVSVGEMRTLLEEGWRCMTSSEHPPKHQTRKQPTTNAKVKKRPPRKR